MSKRSKQKLTQAEKDDLALDRELEATFPASDPTKVTRSSGKSRMRPAPGTVPAPKTK